MCSCESLLQLGQQFFRFRQIRSVEAFRVSVVYRVKQVVGLVLLFSFSPQFRKSDWRTKFLNQQNPRSVILVGTQRETEGKRCEKAENFEGSESATRRQNTGLCHRSDHG